MISNHTQLLNWLAGEYDLQSYLEIGVQNPANNLDKIKCPRKTGVDPEVDSPSVLKMTSDAYFDILLTKPVTFDLIFIDGLHTAEQVEKDFDNSMKALSDKGFIVIHDTLPENEPGTRVPRETKQWWGDVYKWAMRLKNREDANFVTVNLDNGCTVVWKAKYVRFTYIHLKEINWNTYQQERGFYLNIIQPSEIAAKIRH